MSRTEFIVATAIVLFVAFALGVLAHWALSRMMRATRGAPDDLDHLAGELREAEETRDAAIAYFQNRENEMAHHLAETEAELRAAMEGLREARSEADELRAYLDRTRQAR